MSVFTVAMLTLRITSSIYNWTAKLFDTLWNITTTLSTLQSLSRHFPKRGIQGDESVDCFLEIIKEIANAHTLEEFEYLETIVLFEYNLITFALGKFIVS